VKPQHLPLQPKEEQASELTWKLSELDSTPLLQLPSERLYLDLQRVEGQEVEDQEAKD
jgi:hypothetical protein